MPVQKHFLIFALPRSRTSWLSVFLSTDRSHCFHDQSAYSRSLPDAPYEYVGMACTGAAHEWEKWVEKYPEAPIVVIRRSAFECGTKLARVMEGDAASYVAHALVWSEALDEIARRPGVLSVDFQHIDEKAPEIFAHCLPGVILDRHRLKLLLTLNIQPDPEKLRAEARRLSENGWRRSA